MPRAGIKARRGRPRRFTDAEIAEIVLAKARGEMRKAVVRRLGWAHRDTVRKRVREFIALVILEVGRLRREARPHSSLRGPARR